MFVWRGHYSLLASWQAFAISKKDLSSTLSEWQPSFVQPAQTVVDDSCGVGLAALSTKPNDALCLVAKLQSGACHVVITLSHGTDRG